MPPQNETILNNHDLESSDFIAPVNNGESVEIGKSATAQYDEQYATVYNEVLNHVEKFMAKESVIELTTWNLTHNHSIENNLSIEIAAHLVEKAIAEQNIKNPDWRDKLSVIFDEDYPIKCREYWNSGHFVHKKYEKKTLLHESNVTFSSEQFETIRPSKTLAIKMAPTLAEIEVTQKGKTAKSTAETARFLNGEKLALPKSSLYEVIVSDRPKYRDKQFWETEDGKMPRKYLSAKLNCISYNPEILNDLITDLRNTFAWPNDNDATLAIYLGYLIQPLVAHLKSGQMPGYSFQGPSRCGKGYLSNVFVNLIYSRAGGHTVLSKMLPHSTYELEVYLNDVRHALFLVFDEIVHATEEQLVILNSLLTQQTIQVRKFGVGYQKIENLVTIALTSVGKNFSDETEGRLAIIKLSESRPEQIDKFHERWSTKGGELLKALVDVLDKIEIKNDSIAQVSQRRPGFALVSHCIENVFHLKPDYSLQTSENETLDDICEMFFSKFNEFGESMDNSSTVPMGRAIGRRHRYSVKNFCNFLSGRDNRAYKRKEIFSSLLTALSYRSTAFHPIYKEKGYLFRWEKMDRYCHIEFVEESSKANRRYWIYIQDVTPMPEKGESTEELISKNLQLLQNQN